MADLLLAEAASEPGLLDRLSEGDLGIGAWGHALQPPGAAATAAGLFTIILMFGPISGGHFNPVVSLADATFGGIRWRDALAYLPVQVTGCVLGAITANGMFALAAVSISTHHRASPAHLFSEVIATAGLLLVIFSLARTRRANTAPAAVGAYIGAAYFFTSSASFANPAISVGRIFSNTFAGIAPASVPGYVAAQLVGCVVAVLLVRALYPNVTPAEAAEVVVPHGEEAGRDGVRAVRVPSQRGPLTDEPSHLRAGRLRPPHGHLGRDHARRARSPGGCGGHARA